MATVEQLCCITPYKPTSPTPPYPASSLVIVQIHQHPRQLPRVSPVVLLPLPNIDEPLRELVPVRRIVAAAPQDPISVELPRALARAAPAGG